MTELVWKPSRPVTARALAALLYLGIAQLAVHPAVAQTPGWTFTATRDVVDAGQSTTLAFTAPTTDFHNVTINGQRPAYTCSVDSCAGGLIVTPFATTTYQLRSMAGSGAAWPVLSVVVNVIPAPERPIAPAVDAAFTGALETLPRLSRADLVYEGAFKLPWNDGTGRPDSSFRWGGKGIGFNRLAGTLFVSGEESKLKVAEVTVPEVRQTASRDALATADVVQPLADVTDGKYRQTFPGGMTYEYGRWGTFLPYRNKLLASVYHDYDANWQQISSHFVSGLDLSVPNDARGPFRIGGRTLDGFLSPADLAKAEAEGRKPTTTGFTSGYMGEIPLAWQAALGGTVITGNCCTPIISRTSYGPAAFAFDPDQLAGDLVPVPLVYYPWSAPLAPWGGPSPPAYRQPASTLFNGTTDVAGVVFPEGTRTVMFFGRHGLGEFCYGSTCFPGAAQQNHAPPYVYYAWFYDAADFLRVRRGEIQPWDVRPYAVFQLDLPYAFDARYLKGAAYDPATRRIFLSQDQFEQVVIQVFRLPDLPVPPPPVVPSAPATPSPTVPPMPTDPFDPFNPFDPAAFF